MSEPHVWMRHFRVLGYCARGVRNWYAQYGFDYDLLLKTGTPVSLLERTGDALALKACAIARKEAESGQGQ